LIELEKVNKTCSSALPGTLDKGKGSSDNPQSKTSPAGAGKSYGGILSAS